MKYSGSPRYCKPLIEKFLKLIFSPFSKRSESGGAALEYVLVSTVSLLLGGAALGFISSVVRDKVVALAEELGVEDKLPDFDFGIFGDQDP